MKTVLMTLVTLASLTTHAAVLTCQDVQGGPDHGYAVTIDSQTKKATVESITIAGSNVVATLACHFPKAKIQGPDQWVSLASCYEENLADAGYSLEVKTGGIAGITMATLRAVSFFGSKPVASFACAKR